ncbi:hypothetical protein KBY55_35335 [Streptomyces sp. b94]|uniref:hypothetical protein n=1 Tax=Streptomyces sp. b94 TaxID=1827634 RepID=UPI001B360F08|nr:hypothetical protein [Streptomyces sp. b94]MBQ1101179.1 hypothetical protein [Streptomyces sp. b94]
MHEGTHRYTPPGTWGEAVAEAREQALWGAGDAAWRLLRNTLPVWEAPGPLLSAPIGLLCRWVEMSNTSLNGTGALCVAALTST